MSAPRAAVAAALAALLAIPPLAAPALSGGCAVDYTVTETPEERDLTTDEIRAQLRGGSFRDKLAARKQIGKLPREQRLAVLDALASDPDLPTRTIAIQELGKLLPDPGAVPILERVAAEDPDEDLRALAAEKLAPPPED